jgi:hypothetical protein
MFIHSITKLSFPFTSYKNKTNYKLNAQFNKEEISTEKHFSSTDVYIGA